VEFSYPSTLLDAGQPQAFKAKVFGIRREASDVVRLTVRAPKKIPFEFEAGQFLRFRVPGSDEWRSYSMASSPMKPHEMDFLVRLIDGGRMSRWLVDDCEPGALIDAEGPFGSFFLRPARGKHIFIAGGTGLAPILSMIEALRYASGPKPDILVSFGCNSPDQLFALDALELYSQWLPSFEARVSLLEEGGPQKCRRGNPVDAITANDIGDAAHTVAYLCGPPAMIDAARRHLGSLGVPDNQIFNETFVAS